MRIISDFYDYYDCIQKYGIDKSIIYNRKIIDIGEVLPKKVSDILKDYSRCYRIVKKNNHITLIDDVNLFALIIIDKCYIGLEYNGIYFYSEELFNNYLEKYDLKINTTYFYKKRNLPFCCVDIGIDFAIQNKCPIFAYSRYSNLLDREYKTVKNPCLKKYGFYRIVEPNTMYQKIQMFFSGILAIPEKEILPISDELKVQSHGFDKWSFRKKSK
jgi:hypothetical protein